MTNTPYPSTHITGNVLTYGATGVDISFPDILPNDRLILSKVASHGTPSGLTPIVTRSAGSKFTVAGVALDTSDFDFMIL